MRIRPAAAVPIVDRDRSATPPRTRNCWSRPRTPTGSRSHGAGAYPKSCATNGSEISVVLRDRAVVPAGTADYHHEWR
ncbi:hypothetical protein ACIA5D_18960 [Actinoplanes sp. NPDC051513]|uniref:hypothetical protein n=1 Tax=Actinoplanes sp. NPDC051513 TaxID=3363908 RepID=UPI00379F3C46